MIAILNNQNSMRSTEIVPPVPFEDLGIIPWIKGDEVYPRELNMTGQIGGELARVWTAPDARPMRERTFFFQSLADGWQPIRTGRPVN